jgi:type IV pilus assembly protein PilM
MRSSRITVIDCGASHVTAGVFTRAGDRLRLEQFAAEVFTVPSGREEEWPDALQRALATLATRLKIRGAAQVVLPGHLVLTKFIKTPRVEPAKREKVIRFEAQQNIPYALTDVVWGHTIAGESEIDLDVMLCAAKRESIDALCSAVEAAGFSPRTLLPGVLALDGATRSGATETPTLIADIGARSTTLVLLEGGRLHARTLALGGQNVTQQLVESQDCDFSEAETLKISGGNSALLAPAIEAFATRLSQEITRSALHFKRQAAAASPVRILLTGGGARLPDLPALLATRANVPVEIFDPLASVEIQHAAANAGVADAGASLASLVGAARLLTSAARPALNLLPPRLLTQETTRRRQPWLVAAAALAAGALFPWLQQQRAWETALAHKAAAIDAEIAPLRERAARNRANLEKLAALQQQVAALHGVAARRTNWPQLLADLQDRFVKVEDVWLERVQLAAPTGDAAGAPLRLAISGRMLDRTNPLANVSPDIYRRVTELLTSVVDSPFVSAVENERFDNHQPGILRFDVVLVAEPARPL